MAYLVGMDEAGYGPNLGPLVISGTLWRVPNGVDGERLYEHLPRVSAPGTDFAAPETTILIGDSKSLYSPGSGLARLEQGVFAALAASTHGGRAACPTTWRTLLVTCDSTCTDVIDSAPWYVGYDGPVPVDATPQVIATAQQILADALATAGIELMAIRARLIFPEAFNRRVRECGSKGSALSLWTLELVEQLLQPVSDGPILIQSDKHGGRTRYAALLQHVFPEHLIEVHEETRQQSTYRWGPASRSIEARFTAKGERFLPSALASMLSKYLRELAMRAFNRFWQQHVPNLKPTAGYPVDAKRFRQDIQVQRQQLGITDQILWRER